MSPVRNLLLLTLLATAVALHPAVERTEKVFPMQPAGQLELANSNGHIDLSVHDRNEIRVIWEKVAVRKAELAEVEVRLERNDQGLKVEVRRLRRGTRTAVNFRVTVPAGLSRVKLQSVNGRVRADGDVGDLILESVNGSVRHDGDFREGRFSTVNGAITVVHPAVLQGGISARSVNGAIQLEIARKSDFQVQGETMNGSVRSDFKLAVEKHLTGRSISGKVGAGRHSLRVKTINGGIKILAI